MTARETPGWRLFAHPAFRQPFDALVAEATRLCAADPESYKQHPKVKLLKRIVDLIEVEIPRDISWPIPAFLPVQFKRSDHHLCVGERRKNDAQGRRTQRSLCDLQLTAA